MKLTAYGKTDVGLMRSNNEDRFFSDEQLGLFIIADGMGGHAAGEIASSMAVEIICKKLKKHLAEETSITDLQQSLAAAVMHANQAISQAAAENPAMSGMGTTLTVLLFHVQQALLAHVGDSRLYRWCDKKLVQLSHDHTLVADQLRRGIISHKEANKSNLRNILLQAIGVTEKLEICQKLLSARRGDCFLLCSDGLTDMLTDEKINEILTHNTRPEQAGSELIAQALAAGGKDNVTVLLVSVDA